MSTPRPLHVALACAAMGLAAISGWCFAQPDSQTPEPPTEPVQDLPGPPHQALASLVGVWTSTTTFTVPDADEATAPDEQPPASEPGSARVESIMEGRFIAIHESGTMMGEAFTSMKIIGYNNAASVYESTWLYTGSTATMRMRGTSQDDGRIVSLQAQYASADQQNERFLVTMTTPSVDEFWITLTALLPDGTAGPALRTVYTRTH